MARILGPRNAALLRELFDIASARAPAGLSVCSPETTVSVEVPAGLLARLLEAGGAVAEALDDAKGGTTS